MEARHDPREKSPPPQTLGKFLVAALRRYPGSDLLRFHRDGAWVGIPPREVEVTICSLAGGMLTYGMPPGGRVAVLSDRPAETLLADLAILAGGGVCLPLDPALPADKLLEVLKQSEATFILVSDAVQLRRILAIRPELPSVDLVMMFDRPAEGEAVAATVVENACSVGTERLARDTGLLEEVGRNIDSQDWACILHPVQASTVRNGVPLSHRNLLSAVGSLASVLPVGPQDLLLSFLPPSHPFHRTLQYLCLSRGVCMAYGRPGVPLTQDLSEVRPTVAVIEREQFASLDGSLRDDLRSGTWTGRWALEQGRKRAQAELALGRLPVARPWGFRVADHMMLRRLRRRTGGRLRFLVSMGDPLPLEVSDLYFSAGLPLLEGFGLPETAGVMAMNGPLAVRPGTVGRVLPGVQIRIAKYGKIVIRGPMVVDGSLHAGRFALPAVDEEGWFWTGRSGHLDDQGFLHLEPR